MKVKIITTSMSLFGDKGLIKEMQCAPMLGDFIEFTEEESNILDRSDKCRGALLIVLERCFMKNGELCITVDTDEVRNRIGYKNHINNAN